MQGRPVDAVVPQNFFACVGELIDVEADDPDATFHVCFMCFAMGDEVVKVFFTVSLFGPEIENCGLTKKIRWKMDYLTIASFERPAKRSSKNLAAQFFSLKVDHVEIARKSVGHLFSNVFDHSWITDFKCHQHGCAKHPCIGWSVAIPIDHRCKGGQTRFGIRTFPG